MAAPQVITEVSQIAAPSPKVALNSAGLAVSGGVRWAPLGTELPTDATTVLDPDEWVTLGRLSDTGVKRTEDRANTKIYDWGGNTIAILQTQFGIMLDFDLLQVMNEDVQRAAHGEDNVDVEDATAAHGHRISTKINAQLLDTGVWVFDSFYQRMNGRLVLPYARPTKVQGPDWTNKSIASFKLTVESMPDNDGNHAFEYWDDGRKTT